jgi:hypothetical protein
MNNIADRLRNALGFLKSLRDLKYGEDVDEEVLEKVLADFPDPDAVVPKDWYLDSQTELYAVYSCDSAATDDSAATEERDQLKRRIKELEAGIEDLYKERDAALAKLEEK